MVVITYNIELKMNDSSFEFWKDFLSKTKEAYNMCASMLVENNTPLDLHHVHEAVYSELRNKFDTLPAQCIIKIYKEVLAALRSIRSNKRRNADIPQRKQLALRIDKHLYKVRRKERNMSKDMCYRASNTLLATTDANIIVMEDLGKIKKTTSRTKEGFRRKRHNNAMAQVPFYVFREILTHKATLAGKQVETVSPSYTSQTDCRTNKRDGNRNGCRYLCSDSKVYDADWNASINIAKRGKHPFSNVEPIDGRLKFLNGRDPSASHTLDPFKSRDLASQLL